MTVEISITISVLPSGKYAVQILTPQGPSLCEGCNVGGACRAVTLAMVDALGETVDLQDLEDWSK